MPKEKILIADDEPDVLSLCVRIVSSDGYRVTGANNGMEAIEAAKKEHFDLFLTDIMMPGIKGLDAAQTIRQFRPDIICVAMTGFGTMDTAIQALQLGFSEFVVKPFKPADLLLAINRALEKERLRRENARLSALVPLFDLNKVLMTTTDVDELVKKVLDTACGELGADWGVLLLKEPDGRLRIQAGVGFDPDALPIDLKERIAHIVERQVTDGDQETVCPEEVEDEHVAAIIASKGITKCMICPLVAMDELVGALGLAKGGAEAKFAPGERELLSVLCGQAAIAIENARLFEQIRRAYRELQKLDHMKSEFINIAAHELRTPLAILMGHADLLKDEIQDPKIKSRLQIIVRNALRLRELINALLDMRQLQTGEARVRVSVFDIEGLIADVLQDFHLMAETKGIEIRADVPPDLAPLRNDRQKVLIILSNLLHNAIKFTPEGGQVGIEVSVHSDELWTTVWDTGIGIPAHSFENIFHPFYQVEESLTREHSGIGLGLSIAKGMVELCGGRIWFDSKEGAGSRFTFSLPYTPERRD